MRCLHFMGLRGNTLRCQVDTARMSGHAGSHIAAAPSGGIVVWTHRTPARITWLAPPAAGHLGVADAEWKVPA